MPSDEFFGDSPKPDSEPKRPEFRLWTPEEIWAPLEPPDYIIDQLFVRGSLGLIVAYGASLKTWVLLDGCMSVAAGVEFLARFATKRAESAAIDYESGHYELRRRVQRIGLGRSLKTPLEGFTFTTMPEYSLVSDDFYQAIRTLAKTRAFIGIDSLAAGSGGIDENDSRFATSLNRLKAIAVETNAVIVVLHHSRKGGEGDGDEREMVRGSSAIFNACDVVLQLFKRDDGSFKCKQTKARGGKAVAPFVVRVDDTAEDASVVRASDLNEDDEVPATSAAIERAKRELLYLLTKEHDLKTKNAVYARIHGTQGVRIAALRELLERQLVIVHDGAFRLASEVG